MDEIFKALSEKSRLRILSILTGGELCVCELEACLNLTQSNISRHLTVLKNCGILESYKNAQWVYYKISEKFIKENYDLWDYLLKKFAELSNYQIDCENCEKYKSQDLCNYNKRSVENEK